jgi:putative sigma-54 modulation protein
MHLGELKASDWGSSTRGSLRKAKECKLSHCVAVLIRQRKVKVLTPGSVLDEQIKCCFCCIASIKSIALSIYRGHSEFVGSFFNPESNRRIHMNLTISGHHLEVTPSLRSYVTSKLDRIVRHFDQVVDVKVLLTVEKQKEKEGRQRAECNIHVKGTDMFAESSHADLYAAVDELVDKLDRQVVRHKDRLQNHHHEAPKRVM